jgi:hypothetical protein
VENNRKQLDKIKKDGKEIENDEKLNQNVSKKA